MARKQSSEFNADAGLFDNISAEKKTVEPVRTESREIRKSEMENVLPHEAMPSTQGRKGIKVNRMNMAFSEENYEWLRYESRVRGISATQFANDIIAAYRKGIIN